MITKLKTGYRVKYRDEDGTQRYARFPNKRLATEFEARQVELRARRRAGLDIRTEEINYDALCQLYLESYTARSKAWLEQMLRYSRNRWGTVRVRNLRPELVARWLANDLALSAKTKSHIRTAMAQVLKAGVEWGYLDRNPVTRRGVPTPRPDPVRDIRPFTSWAEVELVADKIGARYGPLVRFACATGLRIGEWRELRWQDIELELRELRVARSRPAHGGVRAGGKTDAATRKVALSRHAIAALRDLPAPLHHDNLIFPGPAGGHLDVDKWRTNHWAKALELAQLEYRPPYQMRHTYATLALSEGIPVEWLSGQLGHRDVEVTRRHYARYLPHFNHRMLDILDQIGAERALSRNPR